MGSDRENASSFFPAEHLATKDCHFNLCSSGFSQRELAPLRHEELKLWPLLYSLKQSVNPDSFNAVWKIWKLGCSKCSCPNTFHYRVYRGRQVLCFLYVLVTVQHFFQLIWTILFLVKGPGLTAYSFILLDFSLIWSGKPRRHKDARRHLCFTLTLQTLSSLQHLLAYGCDYHNLSTSSNLFSFFKCSLLPGVELNACASIDIMSPLSPCTNRVSNTLTVYATRTPCSDKIRTLHLRLHTVVHLTVNVCVHVLNGAYFTACTW